MLIIIIIYLLGRAWGTFTAGGAIGNRLYALLAWAFIVLLSATREYDLNW